MTIDFPDLLVVMALPLESQDELSAAGIQVLYTGVGKVNAAIALTRRLAEYRYAGKPLPRVLNFGTAGSRAFPKGSLVECNIFVQRDMDASLLGFPAGSTPFEDIPAQLRFDRHLEHLPCGTCGTGDSFVAAPPTIPCEVVDMEGYALAKVCWLERLPFICVKFVTDGADGDAHDEWARNAHLAAGEFLKLYDMLARNSMR